MTNRQISEAKMKNLIILRGNSGSGKTTVAKELQRKFGRNTMLISQDVIRRDILYVKDTPQNESIALMKTLLTYGYEHCQTVILEGILYAERYQTLFEVAVELYGASIFAYYFDLPFEEARKRHQTKSNHLEFGEEAMRRWWIDNDYSSNLDECRITQEKKLEDIVSEIYAKVTR